MHLTFSYRIIIFMYSFRFRDGDTIDVLADALDDLRKTLQGVRAISFFGDSHDVIEYVAKLFGPSKQYRCDKINSFFY